MTHKTLFGTLVAAFLMLGNLTVAAEELVVEIVEADKDYDHFVLNAYGTKPAHSDIEFYNEFGIVRGNTYNQIAFEKDAYLLLDGWAGCTINSITLHMCSNKESGNASFSVVTVDNGTSEETETLFSMGASSFDGPNWYGEWVGHQNGIFVDITKEMTVKRPITEDEYVDITIRGTKKGESVYLKRITVNYTPGVGVEIESAMGYQYSRLDKKMTLNDNDTILLTYGQFAAGISDSATTYMDVYHVHSFSNVTEPYLHHFVTKKTGNSWYLINLDGDTLGAKGAKHLCWNEGVKTWDIDLEFSGAKIASTNEKYGEIGYNQPSNSVARFTTYTSNMPWPKIYRRGTRVQPVLPTKLELTEQIRNVSVCRDTLVLHAQVTATLKTPNDTRVTWKSLDPTVATVKDGIVKPLTVGSTKIVCTSVANGELADTCELNIGICTAEVVELDEHSLRLYECRDSEVQLAAEVIPANAPDAKLTWTSSNTAVATVTDAGKVKILSTGNVEIVATAQNGVADTCRISIEECVLTGIVHKYPETDKVIELKDCGGIFEGEGERFSIWLSFEPEDIEEVEIVWSSSDEKVAVVAGDNMRGTVRAIAPGKATITAAWVANPEIKLTSQVTVVSCNTAIDQVELVPIFAADGTIFADAEMTIFNLLGLDVTKQNGQLNGVYLVKIGNTTQKIVVK